MTITIASIDRTEGSGKRRFAADENDTYRSAKSQTEYLANHQIVSQVSNNNFCLVYAILLGKFSEDRISK
jgi:hypothetical protein